MYVIPNLYDFLSFKEQKRGYFEKVSTVFVHAIKVIEVWNNIGLIEWWQNIDFGRTTSGANNLKNSTCAVIL